MEICFALQRTFFLLGGIDTIELGFGDGTSMGRIVGNATGFMPDGVLLGDRLGPDGNVVGSMLGDYGFIMFSIVGLLVTSSTIVTRTGVVTDSIDVSASPSVPASTLLFGASSPRTEQSQF